MKKFTISSINHHIGGVYEKYLKKSLDSLEGDFDVIFSNYGKEASKKYNEFIEKCETPYLIITHQDVSFSSDLLKRIEETINDFPEFGAIGMVGVDSNHEYRWSGPKVYEVDTLDSCFIVIRLDLGIKFDEINFDEVHCSTEDYCAQLRNIGRNIYTIKIPEGSLLTHHSQTCSTEGFCWGNYRIYRNKFQQKWPNLKTT